MKKFLNDLKTLCDLDHLDGLDVNDCTEFRYLEDKQIITEFIEFEKFDEQDILDIIEKIKKEDTEENESLLVRSER